MTSKKEKQRRKEIVDGLRAEERAASKASMPLSIDELSALIEYVDCSLDETPCDHSLAQSRAFLAGTKLNADNVVTWLNEHGGFCDCEVIYNVTDRLKQLTYRPPLVALPSKPKSKEPALGPIIATGLGFSLRVEAPWKARRGGETGEGLFVLRLGRKNSRFLHIFAEPPPEQPAAGDELWIQRWLLAKGLEDRGDWMVERRLLGSNKEFQAVTVSTRGWLPVVTWVFDPNAPSWHGLFETELPKAASDFGDLERLFSTAAAVANQI